MRIGEDIEIEEQLKKMYNVQFIGEIIHLYDISYLRDNGFSYKGNKMSLLEFIRFKKLKDLGI